MRKSAWTQQEDDRQYVEKHGDGKWHQVPRETGLNRCRKSCRRRWLNYLNLNLKSRDFSEDEIDQNHSLQVPDPFVPGPNPTSQRSESNRSGDFRLKFLRTRDFRVPDTFTMLTKCLAWRKEFGADGVVDEDLGFKELDEVVAYVHGFDKQGYPVCYNAYGVFFFKVTNLKDMPKRELRFASNQILSLFQDDYPEMVARKLIFDFVVSPRFMMGSREELEENIGEIPSVYKREMINHAPCNGREMTSRAARVVRRRAVVLLLSFKTT
ncbi:hypothetical protein ACFX11_026957 [Malus domestica]